MHTPLSQLQEIWVGFGLQLQGNKPFWTEWGLHQSTHRIVPASYQNTHIVQSKGPPLEKVIPDLWVTFSCINVLRSSHYPTNLKRIEARKGYLSMSSLLQKIAEQETMAQKIGNGIDYVPTMLSHSRLFFQNACFSKVHRFLCAKASHLCKQTGPSNSPCGLFVKVLGLRHMPLVVGHQGCVEAWFPKCQFQEHGSLGSSEMGILNQMKVVIIASPVMKQPDTDCICEECGENEGRGFRVPFAASLYPSADARATDLLPSL